MRGFPSRRGALAAATLAAAALATAGATRAQAGGVGLVLVELMPSARCADAALVVAAGGTPVAPELALYAVPERAAGRLVATLRGRRSLRFAEPNRRAGSLAVADYADPLVPAEWWRAAIGVDALAPPGPGKPVTIVDSGIDVMHPDFLGRPNTELLSPQEPAGLGGEHGTAVGALVGAPADGVGLVGVYPEAVLRSWDAARGAGTELDTFEIVQGILAAARTGPGVVNLSLGAGEKSTSIEQAIYEAVARGTLVVAASGNDGTTGSPLQYPASIPHVLTVGATDSTGGVAAFSSRSRFVDLAAPGTGMTIATALGKGWRQADGTSFAAPLVAGASAWVWTSRPDLDATQLFEVMRRSAVDVGDPGRDDGAGHGLLSVPAALAYPAPVRDPFEPNDDLEFVKPGGFYDTGRPPLTTAGKPRTVVQARLDHVEDPADVYRVWLPRDGAVTATLTATADLDVGLWTQATVSVTERVVGTHRLARAATRGTSERLTFRNRAGGRWAYLAVVFPRGGGSEAAYTLRVG